MHIYATEQIVAAELKPRDVIAKNDSWTAGVTRVVRNGDDIVVSHDFGRETFRANQLVDIELRPR